MISTTVLIVIHHHQYNKSNGIVRIYSAVYFAMVSHCADSE